MLPKAHPSSPSAQVGDFPQDLSSFTNTGLRLFPYDPGNERRPVFAVTDLAIDILVITSLSL